MKKLVWVAGLLLLFAVVYPNGITLPTKQEPVDVVLVAEKNPKIVELLAKASAADKGRVQSIYSGLATVLRRDATVKRLKTTEQWAELQAATLDLAVEQVGKYPGLDVAINDVFLATVGTDDVLPANDETRGKLIKACEIVEASAQ
jgi:hypothetical protein